MADDQIQERRRKRDELKAQGIDPYGSRFVRTKPNTELVAWYEQGGQGQMVRTAGRLTAVRRQGKVSFMDLTDETGRIQIIALEKNLGPAYDRLKLFDLGDFAGIEGTLVTSRTGEVSIEAKDVRILSKSLHPPPEKWHGLKDVDLRYRHRYLDLIANPAVRETFRRRSLIVRTIRRTLDDLAFLEVETPMLHPIPGGAAARPFKTHHNSLDRDLYLRIAPELYLKRLLVGGFERVYEINRNFRNEGLSPRHNPEFTMLELYQAYGDLRDMMDRAEEILVAAGEAVGHQGSFVFQGKNISLARPFARRPYRELLQAELDFPLTDTSRLAVRAKVVGGDPAGKDHDHLLQEVFERTVEPKLIQPTFVTDYPVGLSTLTKKVVGRDDTADRFELFINGMEVGNAYTELNDPVEQLDRFQAQGGSGENSDPEGRIDMDFILALEHGMPPAGGLGMGIDRIVMLLTDSSAIRDVILFPTLKEAPGAGAVGTPSPEPDKVS